MVLEIKTCAISFRLCRYFEFYKHIDYENDACTSLPSSFLPHYFNVDDL